MPIGRYQTAAPPQNGPPTGSCQWNCSGGQCSTPLRPTPSPAPTITGITGVLQSGGTSTITITGNNFGSVAGALGFCPWGASPCQVIPTDGTPMSYSYTSWSNTQIVANVTLPNTEADWGVYVISDAWIPGSDAENPDDFEVPIEPQAAVTPGPTAIMGYAAGAPVPPSNCVPIGASGDPAGGTFQWTTASQSVTLQNANTQTVTICSNPGFESVEPGDFSVNVVYTVNGEPGPAATTAITILWPSAIQTASDTTNPTGHQCIGTQGTIPANSFSQASSYYADALAGATYASYLRNRTYTFQDQFQNAITLSMSLSETYPSSTSNVSTGSGVGAVATDYFVHCSQTCRQGGSETVTSTQTIYANNVPLPTKQVTWTCSGVMIVP